MSADWRTLGAVLGKSVLWGGVTAVVSFLMGLAVFLFVVPRLLDAPGLSAPMFALLVGYGGLFLGLLLGLLLQLEDVLPLPPGLQALHVVAVIAVVLLAWGSTDVAIEPATVGAIVETATGGRS